MRIDRVSKRLSRREKCSAAVRSYLQKTARLLCRGARPEVHFSSIPTARHIYQNGNHLIEITSEDFDQPATSISNKEYQLVIKEGMLVHEVGHVLYTDNEAKSDILDEVAAANRNTFHSRLWNPAEDACIEEQLRRAFSCGDMLDLIRVNMHSQPTPHQWSLFDLCEIAIKEKGCYDVGRLDNWRENIPDNLLDEAEIVMEEVEDMLADVLTEPNARKRYERMLETWHSMRDVVLGARREGKQNQPKPKRDGGSMDDMPDDSNNPETGNQDAGELEDIDEGDVKKFVRQPGRDDEIVDPEEEEEAEGEGEGGSEEAEQEGEDEHEGHGSESSEEGEEEAESGEGEEQGADDQEDQDADESGEGGGDGEGQEGEGGGYPEHEGHNLVLKE